MPLVLLSKESSSRQCKSSQLSFCCCDPQHKPGLGKQPLPSEWEISAANESKLNSSAMDCAGVSLQQQLCQKALLKHSDPSISFVFASPHLQNPKPLDLEEIQSKKKKREKKNLHFSKMTVEN